MLRDLVLRDIVLLLVNRLKKNIFLMNVPLKWLQPEAFFSPKCTIYRLATGLSPDPLGELIALPKSKAGFKGHTSEGRGRRCGEVRGGK